MLRKSSPGAGRLAADERDLVIPSDLFHAAINRGEAPGRFVLRQAQRHERGQRCAAHGRDVAQHPGQRLAADERGGRARVEMNALDHGVGLEEQRAPLAAQHGAVVAHADEDLAAPVFPAPGQQAQQPLLAQSGQRRRLHDVLFSMSRLTAVIRLKQPWMHMGSSSEPVCS